MEIYVVSRFPPSTTTTTTIIHTEILKVNSNLMHATGERFTEHNTRLAIKSKLLERRCAIFALWWYFTHSNFIAYNFDRFLAFQDAPVFKERGNLEKFFFKRWWEIEKLTREIHPRHGKCIASAPVDFLFDAPSVSLSLDFCRTITSPTSSDPIDESFASSSSYILWQE